MKPRILLVNPPVYDFAAYDFWLKPYGLLTVAGYLRGKARFAFFDYLDRLHPFAAKQEKLKRGQWGRGEFYWQQIPNPKCLEAIPRYFRRFGLPRATFQDFLSKKNQCDFVLVQTTMTYWYLGIQEVMQDIRAAWPKVNIVLGGNYVTLCEKHARKLGADLLVPGTDLDLLWKCLNINANFSQPALWETYEKLHTGVLKLSDGCPFNCTYCSVPSVYGKFQPRPMERSLAELELLARLEVENVAFYDDALLFQAEKILVPFLDEVLRRSINLNFHSPNALNARFITKELADLMVQAGFKTFYLGFETACPKWQKQTGAKISCDELSQAVEHLIAAGAQPQSITAYQILGHPHMEAQEIEASMRFVNGLRIRGMLADFSPIPGTPDGEYCRKWVDLDEPLLHNKTAFPIILLGFEEVNRLKDLQRRLNRSLTRT